MSAHAIRAVVLDVVRNFRCSGEAGSVSGRLSVMAIFKWLDGIGLGVDGELPGSIGLAKRLDRIGLLGWSAADPP